MPYCPNCGTQVSSSANFCPSCGAQMNSTQAVVSQVYSDAIYRVILVNRGDCTKALCKEVLRDLLGYTLTTAGALIDAIPVEIAHNLTREQAAYIAEALTEYGMETAICDNNNKTFDFSRYTNIGVFNDSGNFYKEAAAILGTLTIANQVSNIIRWNQPVSILDLLFRPTTRRRTPPPKNNWVSIFGGHPQPAPRQAPPPPKPPRQAPQPARPPQGPAKPKPQVPNPPIQRAPSASQMGRGPLNPPHGAAPQPRNSGRSQVPPRDPRDPRRP